MKENRNDYCGAIALGVGVHAAWLTYEAFELKKYLSDIATGSSGGMAFAINSIILEAFGFALLLGTISFTYWLCSWLMLPGKRRMPTLLQWLGLVSCLPFIYTLLRMLLSILGV